MSTAKPMSHWDRVRHYEAQNMSSWWVTARQLRRVKHKLNRGLGAYEPIDLDIPPAERPKGRPTPRRADVIRAKRAARKVAR